MKYVNLFLSACMSLIFFSEAKIIETAHFKEVIPYIQEDCWFLVDLDNTLFEAKQALGHANWFYDELQERLEKGLTKEEACEELYPLWVKIQEICSVKAVEDTTIPLLLNLQQRNIVMMGFTHRLPLGVPATIRQVHSLGFDFSKTAPQILFDSIPASGGPTCYRQGILFAGDYNSKGEVLLNFLAMIGHRPKKIVFIDDKYKNVEELEKVLAEHNIDYLGIYYTAIKQQPTIYSRAIANFQFKFINSILSNEAAQCLMDNQIE